MGLPARGETTDLFIGDPSFFKVADPEISRVQGKNPEKNRKPLPPKLRAMAKEKNTKQVNTKKEPTKSLKEKRAAKHMKREEKLKNRE